jgi:lysophospholipase L1-like esterase
MFSRSEKIIRVACVGDSITEGSGADQGMSYPSQLQQLLGEGWLVGNFGRSGCTLLKKGDFPYWKEPAYRNALGFVPDEVVIMLGTNDTKPQNWRYREEFLGDYLELVESFRILPARPRVHVCLPCPVFGEGNFDITAGHLSVYSDWIRELAARHSLELIDLHGILADKPHMIPDCVHPSTDGAGEMAKAVFAALVSD